MPWTAKPDSPGVIALRDPQGGLHGLDAADARALAASLLTAADAVEPEERSCFNCAHLSHNIVGVRVCALAYESGVMARSYGFIAATGAMSTRSGLTPQRDASTCGGWAPRRNAAP